MEDEVAAGRLWKARDLLRAQVEFVLKGDELSWALERLGQIEIEMGEDPRRIGHRFFFSGRRLPEYESYIQAFRDAHPLSEVREFVTQFPGGGKIDIKRLPEVVIERLEQEGVPISEWWESPRSGREICEMCGLVVVILLFFGVCIVGLVTIIQRVI